MTKDDDFTPEVTDPRPPIKRALLAGGTKAGLTVIGASNAVLYRHSWRTALNMLRNYQHIYAT